MCLESTVLDGLTLRYELTTLEYIVHAVIELVSQSLQFDLAPTNENNHDIQLANTLFQLYRYDINPAVRVRFMQSYGQCTLRWP